MPPAHPGHDLASPSFPRAKGFACPTRACYPGQVRVVFLSPSYPAEMVHFTRGLAEVGVEVLGVGDTHKDALPATVRRDLSGYLQVPRILDEGDVMERVSGWLRGKTIDRVLTNWEPLVMLAARLRERWGVPGMSVDTARGFRDKELMKERVRAAGLRVPKSRRARTARDVWAAVEEIGFPMIVKPIAGAGSADTYRLDSRTDVEAVLPRIGHLVEAICEEFVEGDELTYDTVTLAGKPVFENVISYVPKPLDARNHEWISPAAITHRDLSHPRVTPGIELGRAVLTALGMDSGFSHMEWFSTPRGEAVFGEVACRPGGAGLVDLMNYSCDIDLYREWARVVCWGHFEARTPKKYSVGVVYKRAHGHGTIHKIEGLAEWLRACGPCVVEEKLLRPGEPRRDWTQSQIADGQLVVRHPDFDETLRMCRAAASGVRLYAR